MTTEPSTEIDWKRNSRTAARLPRFRERVVNSLQGDHRVLVAGFAIIVLFLLAQGVLNHYMTTSIETLSWRIERNSVLSIEYLSRIARDIDQERILVDDHVLETDATKMAAIEERITVVESDRLRAERAYLPLVDQPGESETWQKTRALVDHLHVLVTTALELSRKNLNAEARTEWVEAQQDYSGIDQLLTTLIEINRAGALDSVSTVDASERSAERLNDAVRLIVVVIVGLLAWWMIRWVRIYERRLKEIAYSLEERNRELDAFAGRIAHEMRNAIGPIVTLSFMLRGAAADRDRVLEIANLTESSSRKVIVVTDALLAFSRASRDVQTNECSAVRVAVKDVVEEVSALAAQLEVTIEVGEVADVFVRCDTGLLHIVFANLVGNAVKYLEGKKERRVRISAQRESSLCHIEIADTGPGIPKNVQSKIFEPFFRVEGTRAPGTGIGLATVRRIVDSRGGRITVESEEGQGARFQVWLPLAQTEDRKRCPEDKPPSL